MQIFLAKFLDYLFHGIMAKVSSKKKAKKKVLRKKVSKKKVSKKKVLRKKVSKKKVSKKKVSEKKVVSTRDTPSFFPSSSSSERFGAKPAGVKGALSSPFPPPELSKDLLLSDREKRSTFSRGKIATIAILASCSVALLIWINSKKDKLGPEDLLLDSSENQGRQSTEKDSIERGEPTRDKLKDQNEAPALIQEPLNEQKQSDPTPQGQQESPEEKEPTPAVGKDALQNEEKKKTHPNPSSEPPVKEVKESPNGEAGGSTQDYTVLSGDTLSSIARKKLGSVKRYQEIMKINGFSSSSVLKEGQVIKLPSR